MDIINRFTKSQLGKNLWATLKSPKTIALIKLGMAVVGVVHAIDEFTRASKGKAKLGFHDHDNNA